MEKLIPKKIQSYKDLHTWQKGHELVVLIYTLAKKFPQDEQFGLVSQMKRAAVSITSNISEGYARGTSKDRAHFYIISRASLSELENQILIARDVHYISNDDYHFFQKNIDLVRKMLQGLINATSTYKK